MKKESFATFVAVTTAAAVNLSGIGAAPAVAAPYGSGWYGEVQASVGREDNVSRSNKPVDLVADTITSTSLGGGYVLKLGGGADLLLSGYVSYNRHDTFDDLSNLATSLGADFSWQPGTDYGALLYRAAANVTDLSYKDSKVREGVLYDATLSVSRRFGSRLTGDLGVRHQDLVLDDNATQQSEGTAFDRASTEGFIGGSWSLSPRSAFYAEYGFRHGGFTSTVSGDRAGDINYEAETLDPAFITCVEMVCDVPYAYRQLADAQSLTLGFAFPAGPVAMDISGRFIEAKGESGGDYRDWFLTLGIIWNF